MDLRIVETGNGGDLLFEGGDIRTIAEVYNQPYLAHFGGNKEASSNDNFSDNEERKDWWANDLFLSDKGSEQLNSKFERALSTIELSSSGRLKLERIADEDLNYLEGFSEHESSLIISGVDRVKLFDTLHQGDNTDFAYMWDEAKDEIIDDNNSDII